MISLMAFLAVLAICLMVMSYVFRRNVLAFAAVLPWFLSSLSAYGMSNTPGGGAWDIYYGYFLLTVLGMVLLCIVEGLLIKPDAKTAKEDIYVDQDISPTERYNDRLQRATKAPQLGRRAANVRRQNR